ncbi:MAG: mannosyltransferase family protein [Nanoarchaeota archaeon]|nr:mannosyltransferase family protein [Nanoarchaeota archaeon]
MKQLYKERLKKLFLNDIFSLFIITRVILFLIAYFSTLVIIKGSMYGLPHSFLDIFLRWDAQFYMSIVYEGYTYMPGRVSNVVYFPLYPYLIKAIYFFTGYARIVGHVISNLALLLAAVYLYKLIKLDYEDDEISMKAVFYLFIYPTNIFFSIIYADSLFLFFTLACFYYARKKNFLYVSILGFLLALTKNLGVFIIFPVLIEYFDINFGNIKISLNKIKEDIFYLLLIPAGLILHMLFLYIKFNDPLLFAHAQKEFGRVFTTITTTLNSINNYPIFYQYLFAGFLFFAIFMLAYAFYKKVRLSYLVFSLISMYIYLSANILESIPRYFALLFPIYISMALLGKKYKILDYFFIIASISLMTIITILLINGYWMV